MTRVAVTGGSGFIGSHVVDRLAAAGHCVVVLDVRPPQREDVEWAAVALREGAALAEALDGCGAVFHLAAMANVNDVAAAPGVSVELNVGATAAVLEAARTRECHFVLASTVWVYEAAAAVHVDESTPLNPSAVKHLYTAEKIAAEALSQGYATLFGLPVTVLRYGIPYGPRMREQLVLPVFLKKALAGEPITVAGDGRQYRNFVYVEDLADAHLRVLERGATGTFNLEGPREVAILEIAEAVVRRIPTAAGIVHTESRTGDYQGRVVSRARAARVLGWEPRTSFEDGFEKTVDWFLSRWSPPPAGR